VNLGWLGPVGISALVALTGGCGASPGERVRVIDLLRQLPSAERRPVSGRFEIVDHTCDARSLTSLAVPATSRVIWTLKLPARAVFNVHAAVDGPPGASALFRIGVSDDRIYEQLATQTVTADECGLAWVPISVNLGGYGGWKFSIFYQPGGRTWRLVLGVNQGDSAADRAYWALPGIDTDAGAARGFYTRAR
jgi:hypothetical protein